MASFDINTGIGSVADLISNVMDKFWPDAGAADQARMRALILTVLKIHETNIAEAKHSSIFVAGWRPFVGWASGFALVYSAMVHPVLAWFALIMKWPVPPQVDSDLFIPLLLAMLGVGGLRTVEKFGGVARNNMEEVIPNPVRRATRDVIERAKRPGRHTITIDESDFVINP